MEAIIPLTAKLQEGHPDLIISGFMLQRSPRAPQQLLQGDQLPNLPKNIQLLIAQAITKDIITGLQRQCSESLASESISLPQQALPLASLTDPPHHSPATQETVMTSSWGRIITLNVLMTKGYPLKPQPSWGFSLQDGSNPYFTRQELQPALRRMKQPPNHRCFLRATVTACFLSR